MSNAKAIKIGKTELAVSRAASRDETRYVLNGVKISEAEDLAVATNGRMLLYAKLSHEEESEIPPQVAVAEGRELTEAIVPLTAITGALKMVKKQNKFFPAVNKVYAYEGEMKATDLDTTNTLEYRPIEGVYPNWRQALPEFKSGKTISYGLRTEILETLVKALKDVKAKSIVFTFSVAEEDLTDPETFSGGKVSISAAKVKIQSGIGEEDIEGIVMPMRIG